MLIINMFIILYFKNISIFSKYFSCQTFDCLETNFPKQIKLVFTFMEIAMCSANNRLFAVQKCLSSLETPQLQYSSFRLHSTAANLQIDSCK